MPPHLREDSPLVEACLYRIHDRLERHDGGINRVKINQGGQWGRREVFRPGDGRSSPA
jgi:hypothetical protein